MGSLQQKGDHPALRTTLGAELDRDRLHERVTEAMESDRNIEILIQQCIAAGYQNQVEFLSALFDGFVKLRASDYEAQTVEECHRTLRNVSDELYAIAISRNWLQPVKTRRIVVYTKFSHGEDAARLNWENQQGLYRQLTPEEFWSNLQRRVAFWTAEFLRRSKARSESAAPLPYQPQPTKSGTRQRGPRPTVPHEAIAAVIASQGHDWTTEGSLNAICVELDRQKITIASSWKKWELDPPGWAQALAYDKQLVIKHLWYCLKQADRENPS
jgi:hypothetical protein